jgi:hypothetical protein
MEDLENIENVEEVEVIPTDNTTEELQENIEETITVPEDNTAEIEAEQERLRREHEEYLNSFPDTTVFYREIIERDDGTKALGMPTHSSRQAESWGYLEQHYDESELTYIGTAESGIYYLKDYAPKPETEEQKRARIFESKKIEISDAVQRVIDETAHKRGYDTGVSLMSYATSNNARYHADAVEFSDWRDSVWDIAHDVENKVLAGELDIDDVSVEYVLERLPVLEW